jgi:predicted TIM-barrel fold metal-dependent hydrolase
MVDIDAVDAMNRPFYVRPELAKKLFEVPEARTMAETTFKGVAERHGFGPGEEWRVMDVLGPGSVPGMLNEMEEVGVEYVFMDQVTQWSRREQRLQQLISVDELAKLVEESEGRIIPGVGYNPHRIQESLDQIEYAVEELGFKYVWFQPMTFGIRASNKKCYPLYSKAAELDVPVCFQSGQSAEPLPSEPGHPMYADEIAMDFPQVTILLTHGGWPWTEEWCSMLWRHPNVYGNIGAYYPDFWSDRMIEFVDGRLRDKTLWATNGLGLERCKRQFLELDLEDETKRRVLRENALDVFEI